MKKIYSLFCFLVIIKFVSAQVTLPLPFALATESYSFTGWDSLAAAGTYPANMVFHYNVSSENSSYDRHTEAARDFDCSYNLKARNRIIGLGSGGFAFLATSSAQYNDCTTGDADTNRYVGDAVLAINTTGQTSVGVKWTGTVVTTGDGSGDPAFARQATTRLQYRVGATGNYTDVLTSTDTVEVNTTGKSAGSVMTPTATLPAACNNQALVYLRWVYFVIPAAGSKGTRPEISIDDIAVGAGVLPLNLLSFSVTNSNSAATVSWKTANEVNVSHFEVERSRDGISFSLVATVAAKGNATNNVYSLTDTKAAAGDNYYRLKMADKNGTFSYSGVVRFSANGSGVLRVTPNPVVSNSFILTHPAAGKGAVATVFGIDGKKLASYTIQENNTQTTIRTASLSKGNYLVLYTDGTQKLSVKFAKN